MKKILNIGLIASSILFFSSCDKGLTELNVNQTSATQIDPLFQFNNAILSSSYPTGTITYEMGIVQQLVTPNGGVLAGANFNVDNRSPLAPLWNPYYRSVIRNTRDVINNTKNNPDRSNLMNMARIIQAYAFMVLTDTYGDIPYEEGGLGYINQNFLPEYDPQQEIYNDIVKEFTEATAALNASGRIETGDLLYSGNIAQWKKFGNSLLLRAGMRMSKVSPDKAKQVAQTAFSNGVITDNADNAYIRHDANFQNPIGSTLNGTEAANFYLAKPFVDYLKSTNDPRLSSIAIRYVGATSGSQHTPDRGTTAISAQIGMPVGKDNASIVAAAAADGLVSFYEYSQADRRRINKVTTPAFIVTAAQTQLLLAEAAQRGWISGRTPKEYYEAGVKAHMEQMATYDANAAVSQTAIQDYLTNNPYDANNALRQINSQYWVASFLNGPEAWANFRRSGFPQLAPNPYPGDIPPGTFIRRITYPISEISVNTANVNEAISRMGADKLDTRVWWDKQ